MSFEVLVPASSANLGPGFDSLALAIDLHTRVRVRQEGDAGRVGAGQIDLYGGEDLVLSSMRYLAGRLGRELPPATIETETEIPVARGLGSSAAAIVAGLQAGALLLSGEPLTSDELISIGGELEGHADNISAAVLGGVTAAVATAEGYIAARLAAHLPWQPVLFIPRLTAFTRDARGILPASVPLTDAAANVGRAALLAHALQTGDDRLLGVAMADQLHQPYRAGMFPHLQPMIDAALGAGAAGACLSGAGPTVLALARAERAAGVRDALALVGEQLGVDGDAVIAAVATGGIQVRALAEGAGRGSF